MFERSKLVPELMVTDLDSSLAFWVSCLGLEVAYQRPEDGFAYLDSNGAQVMLEQADPDAGQWLTATLAKPFGRGINPGSWITRFWWSCDGATIKDLVKIYSTDEIAERQQTYEIAEYFPGYLLIGDDSGGRLILVDRSAIERFYLLDSGCPSITDGLTFSSMDVLIKEVVG